MFKPVLDGKVIADYPDRLLLQGKHAKVPLITGYFAFNFAPVGRGLKRLDLDTSQTRLW